MIRTTIRLLVGLAVAAALVLLASVEAAGAAPDLSGCHGRATSVDADGQVIDEAVGEPPHDVVDPDGEDIFTSGNPFVIDADGAVSWSGESTSLIVDGEWTVKVWGITLDDGKALNRERTSEKEGTYSLEGILPSGAHGLALVDVSLEGEGGTCRGTGFVKVGGSPLLSPPWLVGAGLVLVGLGLLFVAQPKQVWRRG
jgi:hypothetical protein